MSRFLSRPFFVSDDKLSVKEIHALQRRLKLGISSRQCRLRQLSRLLVERCRAERASRQSSGQLQKQALLQEALAAEAESRAQEAASLVKKASLTHASEELALRISRLAAVQRSL